MDATTIEARQRFFGPEHVDPNRGTIRDDAVVLSWFGVSSFALAAAGKVLLLDAWIPRGFAGSNVPAGVDDLVALRPDAILVGHGHFDHAADVPAVWSRTDAVLVAAPETTVALRGAVREASPRVVPAVPAACAPGEHHRVDAVDGIEITAVRHVHSTAVRPDGRLRRTLPIPDPTPMLRRPPRPADLLHLGRHLLDRGGPPVLYQLRVDGLTLTWHDTTGPLPERAPAVLDTLRALAPTDVHVPAIMGFNQVVNGLRDVRLYVESLAPRLVLPSHHDHWLPPLTAPGDGYARPLEDELGRIEPDRRPEVRFLRDPADYLRPIVLAG